MPAPPAERGMYMAEQLPAGKSGVWAESNHRQRAWLSAGGKILRWAPSQSMDDWHDPFHPKAKEVIRCVSAALRGGMISGHILLGGDSTVAYCSDRKKEMPMKKLAREIRKRCHAVKSIRIVSVSGAGYKGFLDQIVSDEKSGGGPYDEYVLFGGWNDDGQSEEFVENYTKRLARQWRDEFASSSEDGGWTDEYDRQMRRSRWSDEEWAEWRQSVDHRRWTEDEWRAWNQNRTHRTWTDEDWRAWEPSRAHRPSAERERIAWNENGIHQHQSEAWRSWRNLDWRSRSGEEDRAVLGHIGRPTRSEEEEWQCA